MRRSVAALLGALLAAGLFSNPAAAARPQPGTVGVNLGPFYSWGEPIPFVDVFKMSSPWTLHGADGQRKPNEPALDAQGWVARLEPGEYAETTIFTGSTGHYPAGTYTLTYEGKGSLTVGGAGVKVISDAPGRMVLQVQPTTGADNGIQIRETRADPAAPIRKIRVFLPGYTAEPKDNPFNPAFLTLLRPFKVIRFIGWAHVDRSETSSWSDARPVDYATQAPVIAAVQKLGGVALEYQIELANLLHADPWFLVPLKADDDFVRNMAALVHQRLDKSLHAYVEVSNEVWNGGFPEGAYSRTMGRQLGLDNDSFTAGGKWYAGRAVHVFDLWYGVFGADAPRLVRVLAGAYSLPSLTQVELSYQDAYKHIDAFAIAPYIGPRSLGNFDVVANMKPEDVAEQVRADVAGKMHDFMGYQLAYTKKYGVDLVAYEGGPSLMSVHAPAPLQPRITELFREAAQSPAMAAVYRGLLDQWFSSGGSLYMHFDDCSTPNQWGAFGLVDYQYQDPKTSPLFQMFSSYIADREGAAGAAKARN